MASESKPERKARRAAPAARTPQPPAGRRATPARRPTLNLDSEQRARLMLIAGVLVVLAIAVAFIAFGYWYSVVRPRGRTVLQVDQYKVSYQSMKRRMAYEFVQNTQYQSQQGVQVLGEGAYAALLAELITVSRAESSLGVGVASDEFDQKLRTKIGAAVDADQQTFADRMRVALSNSGLTEREYRRLVLDEQLTNKITDKFKSETPATLPQAKLEVIQAATQADAQSAIGRINGGEDFATVAKAVSTASDAQATGGAMDYGPKGTFDAAYDEYAFTAEPGKLSAPLSSSSSGPFYVVRVIDRSDQPVSDTQKTKLASTKLNDWLTSTQSAMVADGSLKRSWSSKDQNDALAAIQGTLVRSLQQQQQKQQAAQQVQQTTVAQLTASPQVVPAGATPGADTTAAAGVTVSASDTTVVPNVTPPLQPVAPAPNGP